VLAPLVRGLPGQLFAGGLARVNGLDPDRPAGLAKVSLTQIEAPDNSAWRRRAAARAVSPVFVSGDHVFTAGQVGYDLDGEVVKYGVGA
jgi:hypothetical protein